MEQTGPTRRTRKARALHLSGFFWGLPAGDRFRLVRAMRALLGSDHGLPDREVILQAADQRWPDEPRPASVEHVRSFFLERPDVADTPGAYGV